MKSLQVLGTVQTGAPTTPVVFSTSVSVYVMGGLVGVSVPLAGVGAVGIAGFGDCAKEFAAGVEDFELRVLSEVRGPVDGDPAKLNIASEALQAHRKTTVKFRKLTKPDFDKRFFFMGFMGFLIS
jgi:hypothetical protein